MFAEGEDDFHDLRAVQIAVEEGMAGSLIGRPAVVMRSASSAPGCAWKAGNDFDLVNPEDDLRFRQFWEAYHGLKGRDGITPRWQRPRCAAQLADRRAVGALGYADGMLCGPSVAMSSTSTTSATCSAGVPTRSTSLRSTR